MKRSAWPLLLGLLGSACSNLSGLDGSSKYACKAPDGVQCDSVSGTYHNALQHNLPVQRQSQEGGHGHADPVSPSAAPAAPRQGASLLPTVARSAMSPPAEAYPATPLRSAPRVWRLWIKAWEDADRDLNGESVVYVQVDNGRWMLDHVQRQAREGFAPVRAGRVLPASTSKPDAPPPAAAAPPPVDDADAVNQVLRALPARPGSH